MKSSLGDGWAGGGPCAAIYRRAPVARRPAICGVRMGVYSLRRGWLAGNASFLSSPALPLRRSRSSLLTALCSIQNMSTVALSLLAIAAASSGVLAQDPSSSALIPLASKHFDWNDLVCSFSVPSRTRSSHRIPALPSRHRQPRPWYPAGLQPVQLDYRGPRLHVSDGHRQPPRRLVSLGAP